MVFIQTYTLHRDVRVQQTMYRHQSSQLIQIGYLEESLKKGIFSKIWAGNRIPQERIRQNPGLVKS